MKPISAPFFFIAFWATLSLVNLAIAFDVRGGGHHNLLFTVSLSILLAWPNLAKRRLLFSLWLLTICRHVFLGFLSFRCNIKLWHLISKIPKLLWYRNPHKKHQQDKQKAWYFECTALHGLEFNHMTMSAHRKIGLLVFLFLDRRLSISWSQQQSLESLVNNQLTGLVSGYSSSFSFFFVLKQISQKAFASRCFWLLARLGAQYHLALHNGRVKLTCTK